MKNLSPKKRIVQPNLQERTNQQKGSWTIAEG